MAEKVYKQVTMPTIKDVPIVVRIAPGTPLHKFAEKMSRKWGVSLTDAVRIALTIVATGGND